MAIDPALARAFVVEYPDLVAVVNLTASASASVTVVGSMPSAIVFVAPYGEVYVANSQSDNVTVLNATSGRSVANLAVGSFPDTVAFDPGTGAVAVGNAYSATITWIDAATHAVTGTTNAGFYVGALTDDPATGEVFGTGSNVSTGWPEVGWFRPGASAPIGEVVGLGGGSSIAYVPVDSDVVVEGGPVGCACEALDELAEINATGRLVGTIPVPLTPEGLAYDPATARLVVTEWTSAWAGTDALAVIDPINRSLAATLPFAGECPQGLAWDAASAIAVVAEACGTTLTEVTVPGGTATDLRVSGSGPEAVALDPETGEVYVANYYAANVTLLSGTTGRPTGSTPVGYGPIAELFDPSTHDLWVANSASNNITVIDARSERSVANISVGRYPDGLALDPTDGTVWVANYVSSNLSVISATSFLTVATVAAEPGPLAVVYDPGAGAVFVADSVNQTLGVIRASDERPSAWYFLPGTPLSLAVDSAYHEVDVGVTFAEAVGTSVSDRGPAGLVPATTFELADAVVAVADGSGAIVANPSVGMAPFAIAVDPFTQEVVSANLNADNLSVLESGTLEPVTGVPTPSAPTADLVNLSDGVLWVADSGANAVSILSPSRILPSYSVTFSESGAVGLNWSVSVDGFAYAGLGASAIGFTAPNGSYSYVVTAPVGYVASPGSGVVRVNGGNVTLPIRLASLTPTFFLVEFAATGLEGQDWGVSLNGSSEYAVAGAPLLFNRSNGTYTYLIDVPTGYVASPPSGSLVVAGRPVVEVIAFAVETTGATAGRVPLEVQTAVLAAGVAVGVLLAGASGRRRRPSSPR